MEKILYRDSLIEIRNESILIKHYYFPFISKNILLSNIEKIEIRESTLMNGKWRIWGTGRFTNWFPVDILRPMRNKIFFITSKNKHVKTGFTVRDSERVEEILKNDLRVLNNNIIKTEGKK